MTHKVLKSAVARMRFSPEDAKRGVVDFPTAVKNFSDEMRRWKEREDIVARQEPLPPRPQWRDFAGHEDPVTAFTQSNRAYEAAVLGYFHTFPRPTAHPDIEAAISESFEPDYEVINDDPSPDEVLRSKKDALLHSIAEAESNAKALVALPPGKQRLACLKENDIRARDEKIASEIAGGFGDSAPPAAGFDMREAVASRRDPTATKFLQDQQTVRDAIAAIERAAAQAMSDVEDLTISDIAGFQIPSFT